MPMGWSKALLHVKLESQGPRAHQPFYIKFVGHLQPSRWASTLESFHWHKKKTVHPWKQVNCPIFVSQESKEVHWILLSLVWLTFKVLYIWLVFHKVWNFQHPSRDLNPLYESGFQVWSCCQGLDYSRGLILFIAVPSIEKRFLLYYKLAIQGHGGGCRTVGWPSIGIWEKVYSSQRV